MLHRLSVNTLKLFLSVTVAWSVAYSQSVQLDAATKESLSKAMIAYQNNDFASARQELQRFLSHKKDLAAPYLLLGMVAWREGKNAEAVKSVKEAIKLQPVYPDAHYVLGKLYFEKENWKDVEVEAKLAVDQGAKYGNAYVLLGDTALMQEKYELALTAYENAVIGPAPNSDVTEELKGRIVGIKNRLEFMVHKEDSNYKLPKFDPKEREPDVRLGTSGKVIMAGLLNEKGEFISRLVVSTEGSPVSVLELKRKAGKFRFTPAMKNGVAVPYWISYAYERKFKVVDANGFPFPYVIP